MLRTGVRPAYAVVDRIVDESSPQMASSSRIWSSTVDHPLLPLVTSVRGSMIETSDALDNLDALDTLYLNNSNATDTLDDFDALDTLDAFGSYIGHR